MHQMIQNVFLSSFMLRWISEICDQFLYFVGLAKKSPHYKFKLAEHQKLRSIQKRLESKGGGFEGKTYRTKKTDLLLEGTIFERWVGVF